MTHAAALPHDHDITVGPDAIDFMGHVNNAHYLSWVQDAVLSHWRKIAPPEALARAEQAVIRAGAHPLPYEAATAVS